jgi:hypothetical protein
MPLHVGDVSDFARTLRRQLDAMQRTPGHVEMLNLLARAGGYRNIQHLRAHRAAAEARRHRPPTPQTSSWSGGSSASSTTGAD